MIKIIIGALVGFFVWSALWIGSEFVINFTAPAIMPLEDFSNMTTTYLALKLALSVLFSVVSGYIAAVVAGERRQSPLILGVVLFFFGLGVQLSYFDKFPKWYTFTLLLLLLPMSVLGSRLRR